MPALSRGTREFSGITRRWRGSGPHQAWIVPGAPYAVGPAACGSRIDESQELVSGAGFGSTRLATRSAVLSQSVDGISRQSPLRLG